MKNIKIKFCGWTGPESSYGLFEIERLNETPNPNPCVSILVVHEGDWIRPLNNMFSWPECDYYEQAQQFFGDDLDLIEKKYDEINNCSSFQFALPKDLPLTKIVVPATGEELFFRIYGIDKSGNKELLIEREL